jgi:hypothetical protein
MCRPIQASRRAADCAGQTATSTLLDVVHHLFIIHNSQTKQLPLPAIATSRRPSLPSRARCYSACSFVVAARPQRTPVSQKCGRPISRPVSRPGSQVLNPILQGRRRNRPRRACAGFPQLAKGRKHNQQRASGAEAATAGANGIDPLVERAVWLCAPTSSYGAAPTPHRGRGAHSPPRQDNRKLIRVSGQEEYRAHHGLPSPALLARPLAFTLLTAHAVRV